MRVNNNYDLLSEVIDVSTGIMNVASGVATAAYVVSVFAKLMRGDNIRVSDVAPLVVSALTYISTR